MYKNVKSNRKPRKVHRRPQQQPAETRRRQPLLRLLVHRLRRPRLPSAAPRQPPSPPPAPAQVHQKVQAAKAVAWPQGLQGEVAARVGGRPALRVDRGRGAGRGVGGELPAGPPAQVQHPRGEEEGEEAAEDIGRDQEAQGGRRRAQAGQEAQDGDAAPGERHPQPAAVPAAHRDGGGEDGLRRAAAGEEQPAAAPLRQGQEEAEGGAEVPLDRREQGQAGGPASHRHHQARQRGRGESLF